jgi:hypothetical protein
MYGTGAKYIFLVAEGAREGDRRSEEEWRALHRRPDAAPLPTAPAGDPGLRARAFPVLRRLLLGLG